MGRLFGLTVARANKAQTMLFWSSTPELVDFPKTAFYKAIDGYFIGHILDYLHTCAKQQLAKQKTTK